MPTLVCQRCDRRTPWGPFSGQAWLEHRNGDGSRPLHVCPNCVEELSDEQRTLFERTGRYEGVSG